MLTAVEKILLDVQEALEGYYAGRSAQQVLQRSSMLPAQYASLHDRFERLVQTNYPVDATYALLDEIEHTLHELASTKKEEQKQHTQKQSSPQSHPAAWQNKPTRSYFDTPLKTKEPEQEQEFFRQKTALLWRAASPAEQNSSFPTKTLRITSANASSQSEVSPVKLSENTPSRQEIRSPFGAKHGRMVAQKTQQARQIREDQTRADNVKQAHIAYQESRVAFFREAITQQSTVTRRVRNAPDQTIAIKPELDVDCWLRREYLANTHFSRDAEWEETCATAGYFFDGKHGVAETYWDIEGGSYPDKDPTFNKLGIEGLLYPVFAKNWYTILKRKRVFFFCGEVVADIRRLFLPTVRKEDASEQAVLARKPPSEAKEHSSTELLKTDTQKRIESFLAKESSKTFKKNALMGALFSGKKARAPRKFDALPEQVLTAKAWGEGLASLQPNNSSLS